MNSMHEFIEYVSINGENFGMCNPTPTSDYNCGFYDCTDEWAFKQLHGISDSRRLAPAYYDSTPSPEYGASHYASSEPYYEEVDYSSPEIYGSDFDYPDSGSYYQDSEYSTPEPYYNDFDYPVSEPHYQDVDYPTPLDEIMPVDTFNYYSTSSPAPSEFPSPLPTYVPTPAPSYYYSTSSPAPSQSPSHLPTYVPTPAPSYAPIEIPTYIPTPSPGEPPRLTDEGIFLPADRFSDVVDVEVFARRMRGTCRCTSYDCYSSKLDGDSGDRLLSLFLEVIFEPIAVKSMWISSPWSSCRLPGGSSCGIGTKFRSLACHGLYSSSTSSIKLPTNSSCASLLKPYDTELCEVPCSDVIDQSETYTPPDGCECVNHVSGVLDFSAKCQLGSGKPWCYVENSNTCPNSVKNGLGDVDSPPWVYCEAEIEIGIESDNGCDCLATWKAGTRKCSENAGGCCAFGEDGELQYPVCKTVSNPSCSKFEQCTPHKYVATQSGTCGDIACASISNSNDCAEAVSYLSGKSVSHYSLAKANSANFANGCSIDSIRGNGVLNGADSSTGADYQHWAVCKCKEQPGPLIYSWKKGPFGICVGECGGTGVRETQDYCVSRTVFDGWENVESDVACETRTKPPPEVQSCTPDKNFCSGPKHKSRWRFQSSMGAWTVGELHLFKDTLCRDSIQPKEVYQVYTDGAAQYVKQQNLFDFAVSTRVSLESRTFLEFRFEESVQVACIKLFDTSYAYEKTNIRIDYWDGEDWARWNKFKQVLSNKWTHLNSNWGRSTSPTNSGVKTIDNCFCQADWVSSDNTICGGQSNGCCNIGQSPLGPSCPIVIEGICRPSSFQSGFSKCDVPGFKMIQDNECRDYGCREVSRDDCLHVANGKLNLPTSQAKLLDTFIGSHCMWNSKTKTASWSGTTSQIASSGCSGEECRHHHKLCVCSLLRYEWRVGEYSACSVSCGGGFKERVVDCVSVDDSLGKSTVVHSSLCDEAVKPVESASCNQQSCYKMFEKMNCVAGGAEFVWDANGIWENNVDSIGERDDFVNCRIFSDSSYDADTVVSTCTSFCDSIPTCIGVTISEKSSWSWVGLTTQRRCCFRSSVTAWVPTQGTNCFMKKGVAVAHATTSDFCHCQAGWVDPVTNGICELSTGGCCNFGSGDFYCPTIGDGACADVGNYSTCNPKELSVIDFLLGCSDVGCKELKDNECEAAFFNYGLYAEHNLISKSNDCKIRPKTQTFNDATPNYQRLCTCPPSSSLYFWQASPWSDDNVCLPVPGGDCGDGYQERSVFCVSQPVNGSSNFKVSDQRCDPNLKPQHNRSCNYGTSCMEDESVVNVQWTMDSDYASTFSSEAKINDFKEMVRREFAQEMGIDPDRIIGITVQSGSIIVDFVVTPIAGENTALKVDHLKQKLVSPTTDNWSSSFKTYVEKTKSVDTVVYGYVVEEWSDCSKACNGGTRSRTVRCKEQSGHISKYVDISDCDSSTRPSDQEMCNTSPCKNCNVFSPGDQYELFASTADNQNHDEEVIVSCAAGHSTIDDELIGSVICDNGNWTSLGLSCGQDCGSINNFDSSQHRFQENVVNSRHGSTARILCLEGFSSSDPNGVQITCSDGKWSSWSLSCSKNCEPFQPASDLIVQNSNSGFHGSSLTLTCPRSHSAFLEKNNKIQMVGRYSMRCENGQWAPADNNMDGELVCYRNCDTNLATMAATSYSVGGIAAHATTMSFSCSPNYAGKSGVSQMNAICRDGTWDFNDDFQCLRVCSRDVELDFTYAVEGIEYTEGSSRRVRCADSYSVGVDGNGFTSQISEIEITCTKGDWTVVPFSCYSMCSAWPFGSDDFRTEGVIVSHPGEASHGHQISLTCMDGYSDANEKPVFRTCQNGWWHGNAVRNCRESCPGLSLSPAYSIEYSETWVDQVDHGTMASITCASGYENPKSELAEEAIRCRNGKFETYSISCKAMPFFKDLFQNRPIIGYSAAGGVGLALLMIMYTCYYCRKQSSRIRSLERKTAAPPSASKFNLNFEEEPKPSFNTQDPSAGSSLPGDGHHFAHQQDKANSFQATIGFQHTDALGSRAPATNPAAGAFAPEVQERVSSAFQGPSTSPTPPPANNLLPSTTGLQNPVIDQDRIQQHKQDARAQADLLAAANPIEVQVEEGQHAPSIFVAEGVIISKQKMPRE